MGMGWRRSAGQIGLLKEPIGVQKVSDMLEPMGRVMLAVLESTPQGSLHLCPADPEVGEGKRPCLQELQTCGDFAWSSKVKSLGQEGFLVDVESAHFRVDVLELHPEPQEGPSLLLECLALGDSTDISRAAALCGDCLVAASSLTCW